MSKPLSEFTGALVEAAGPLDPPAVLVLRRKGIRQIGPGQRVALYVNDGLNIEIAMPYAPGKIGGQKVTATVKEAAHDDMYGEYLNHLGHRDLRSAQHVAGQVERAYGTDAVKHFRSAAEHHIRGDVEKASHHYHKFESTLKEHTEQLEESVLHKLRHIARSKQFGDIMYKGGQASRVDPRDATKVLKFWSVAHDKNRKVIEKMINSGDSGLQQVCKFVDDHMKHKKSGKK
jgi:hypothetical protein